ncbi:hypothetical protein N7520_009392 [Penicillium odoratum]|uniref:uncharacterized protein n=1 Tax=Penicillium odoratum TaxID=1167516 RepID=UPI002548D524|nr:uncharacterized protein N7520_009392 [Penicillium odoratum]KAJ5752475.1 hypothetical protein N7520_009392 [Penicillium odoratum]
MLGVKRHRDDDLDSELDADPQNKKLCQPWQTSDLRGPSIDLDPIHFRAPNLTPVESSDEGANSKKQLEGVQYALNGIVGHSLEHPWPPTVSNSTAETPAQARSQFSPWLVTSSNDMSIKSVMPHSNLNQASSTSGTYTAIPIHSSGPVAYGPGSSNPDQHSTQDVVNENGYYYMHIGLPSPISEDDNDTTMGSFPSDTDLAAYSHSPRGSPDAEVLQNPAFLTPVLTRRPTPIPRAFVRTERASPKKPTIAMGYRADCEKCRSRVPGHYSHIIRN